MNDYEELAQRLRARGQIDWRTYTTNEDRQHAADLTEAARLIEDAAPLRAERDALRAENQRMLTLMTELQRAVLNEGSDG